MIEAVKFWNEPNNKSHWDLELDPGWAMFGQMARLAGLAIAAESPGLTRVLGGMSPIDPNFMRLMIEHGAVAAVNAVAVHGFPLDWNLWPIHEWPQRLDDIRAVVPDHPVWVSEVGDAAFGDPDRPVRHYGADVLEPLRPFVDRPQVPVEREAVHGYGIDGVHRPVLDHQPHEVGIDRRHAAQHAGEPRALGGDGKARLTRHLAEHRPARVKLEVPVRLVVGLVPDHHGIDHGRIGLLAG